MTDTSVSFPYTLRSTGIDSASLTASPNRFRAIITIDSEPYQVGDDYSTKAEAQFAIDVVVRRGCTFQIYDDQGEPILGKDTNFF